MPPFLESYNLPWFAWFMIGGSFILLSCLLFWAKRRQSRQLANRVTKRLYFQNGEFTALTPDDETITLEELAADTTRVGVHLPWRADSLWVLIHFGAPRSTGKQTDNTLQNSAPWDQWAQRYGANAYQASVIPGAWLSRVVIHHYSDGTDMLELVFDQGWETRMLIPL